MLSSITWTQFFLFLGAATLIWVLYVLRFHILGRHPKQPDNEGEPSPSAKRFWSVKEEEPKPIADPASRWQQNHLPTSRNNEVPEFVREDEETGEDVSEEDNQDYIALESLALEISELTASLGITTTEEKLLEALKRTIERYPTLDNPAHQAAINHLITRCALQDCAISVPDETAASLWHA